MSQDEIENLPTMKVEDYTKVESNNSNNPAILATYEGPIQKKTENKNKRKYKQEFWDDILTSEETEAKLEKKLMFGKLSHPDEGVDFDLNEVSHSLVEITDGASEADLNDELIYGTIEIFNTEPGQHLNTLLEAGVGLGVSSRALVYSDYNGDVEEITGGEFFGVDFVVDPSVEEAYPERTESHGEGRFPYDKPIDAIEQYLESRKEDKQAKVLTEAIDTENSEEDSKMKDKVEEELEGRLKGESKDSEAEDDKSEEEQGSEQEEQEGGEKQEGQEGLEELQEAFDEYPEVKEEIDSLIDENEELKSDLEKAIEKRMEDLKKGKGLYQEKKSELKEAKQELKEWKEKSREFHQEWKETAKEVHEEWKNKAREIHQEALEEHEEWKQHAKDVHEEWKQHARDIHQDFKEKAKEVHQEKVAELEDKIEGLQSELKEAKQEAHGISSEHQEKVRELYVENCMLRLNEKGNDRLRSYLEEADSLDEIELRREKFEQAQKKIEEGLPLSGVDEEEQEVIENVIEDKPRSETSGKVNRIINRIG